jgi:glyoxylase-like metal-dependent hydrolase (beta-lactamase superfamily II)
MRELVAGVFIWSRISEPHGYDFNGTLVLHEAGNLCIDPVDPSDEDLDWLANEGVARVLITNRNHTRAANRVRERTGARVEIHPADAAYARDQGTPLDAELEHGQRVGPFTVVGVPGKSPGEIALHDPVRRLLVVGDACVRRLLELDFDTLLVGDGVPIRDGGRERLRELVASFPAA